VRRIQLNMLLLLAAVQVELTVVEVVQVAIVLQ
jgi:hypothetical protein